MAQAHLLSVAHAVERGVLGQREQDGQPAGLRDAEQVARARGVVPERHRAAARLDEAAARLRRLETRHTRTERRAAAAASAAAASSSAAAVAATASAATVAAAAAAAAAAAGVRVPHGMGAEELRVLVRVRVS